MIITRQKSLEKICSMLDGKKNIFLFGCGDCAAQCKTGGEPELKALAEALAARGKTITGMVVPETTCASAQAKIAFAKNKEALKNTEAVVVMACGSGVQCVKESDRLNLDVYPGCDSLHAALIDKNGLFKEVCSVCGDCLLDITEGVCPVTRCAKSLLNGPCGGQNKGKCETDKERDCAWILIYQRLKEKGREGQLKERRSPRSHDKLKTRN